MLLGIGGVAQNQLVAGLPPAGEITNGLGVLPIANPVVREASNQRVLGAQIDDLVLVPSRGPRDLNVKEFALEEGSENDEAAPALDVALDVLLHSGAEQVEMVQVMKTLHDDSGVLLHRVEVGQGRLAFCGVVLEAREADIEEVPVKVEVGSRAMQIERLHGGLACALGHGVDGKRGVDFRRHVRKRNVEL